MQESENMKTTKIAPVSDVGTPVKDWHMPVLTIIPANSAENGPGALPDSGGIDFS